MSCPHKQVLQKILDSNNMKLIHILHELLSCLMEVDQHPDGTVGTCKLKVNHKPIFVKMYDKEDTIDKLEYVLTQKAMESASMEVSN